MSFVNNIINKYGNFITHKIIIDKKVDKENKINAHIRNLSNTDYRFGSVAKIITSNSFLEIFVHVKVNNDDIFVINEKEYRIFKINDVFIKNNVSYTKVLIYEDDIINLIDFYDVIVTDNEPTFPRLGAKVLEDVKSRIIYLRSEGDDTVFYYDENVNTSMLTLCFHIEYNNDIKIDQCIQIKRNGKFYQIKKIEDYRGLGELTALFCINVKGLK